MAKPFKHDPQWARAKDLCRLNREDIRMAKELGLSPRALVKNIPGPSQRWKLPVRLWLRELHEKRFRRRQREAISPLPGRVESKPDTNEMDIPFQG